MFFIFIFLFTNLNALFHETLVIPPAEMDLPWNTGNSFYTQCPMLEKHFFACNYQRNKPSCVCNYDDAIWVPHPNHDTCDHVVSVPDNPNIVAKIIVAKDRHDVDMEFHLIQMLANYGRVPEEVIVVVRKRCIDGLPNMREFYIVLSVDETFNQIPPQWISKSHPLQKQMELNITNIEIINGGDLLPVAQNIYGHSSHSYAKSELLMIVAVMLLVGLVLFLAFYAVSKCHKKDRDTVKWSIIVTST